MNNDSTHTQSEVWKSKQGSKEGKNKQTKKHAVIYSGKENNYGQLLHDYTKKVMVQKSCSFKCYLVDSKTVIYHWITMEKNFPLKMYSVIQTSSANVYVALLFSTLSPPQLTLIYKHK